MLLKTTNGIRATFFLIEYKKTLFGPIKTKKTKNRLILSLFRSVGITGLEPATSRPPDVCATNCAKSRSFKLSTDPCLSNAGAKVHSFCEIAKFFRNFFC